MHDEPVIAQFLQSLHAPRNLWTATDLSGEFTDSVNAVTEYLTLLDRLYLKMRNVNRRAFPDLVILGTCGYHPTWIYQRRKVKTYNELGKVVTDVTIVDQPRTYHIPLSDLIWPANAWDTDPDAVVAPARWVGHRFKLTENQLRALGKGQEPFLPNFNRDALDFVLKRESEEEQTVERQIREGDQYRPARNAKIELFRIEARFDVDDDGIDEDVIAIFHYKTATILQATHQYWHHSKRLYEIEQYIQKFSMLGKGIAAMNEWAQAAASKLLNAQINNAVLANTRMFGVPQGYNMQPGEPVYPGKVWPLGPDEQISEVKLTDAYQSIFQILGWLQQISEARTSVTELRQGNVSGLPSRTPATTVLTLMQEGAKKFDMILANLRTGAIANIGKRTLQMVAQRHQSGSTKWAELAYRTLGEEDGAKVVAVLSLPQTVLEEGLGIEVTATSSQVNREVEKQNLIGLAQIMQQSYAGLIQVAQLLGDQNLMGQAALASYNGGIEFLTRLLESFEIQNPERYLPEQIGNGGAPGVGAPGGMGGLPLAPTPTTEQLQLLQSLTGLG
jgi:hypothetical protein